MNTKGNYKKYLEYIKNNLSLALGCTEPAAIALTAATAYDAIKGDIHKVDVDLGINMYKNALYVGIPGIKEKGIDIAVLLGMYCGNPKNQLEIFNDVTDEYLKKACKNKGLVNINVIKDIEQVLIDVTVYTDKGKSRCRIENTHTNVVLLEVNDEIVFENTKNAINEDAVEDLNYEAFLENIDSIPVEKFDYILAGIEKLQEITDVGLNKEMPIGIGSTLQGFINNGMLANDIINNTAIKISAAAEARLSGEKVSVMSCGGSGSQGIATILPILEMAKHMHVAKNRMIKAIVVGYGTTLYAKKALGRLSCVCGCAIASSIGSTVGIVWMQGGTIEEMKGAINNVVGSLTGVICDGAKIGCAFKMAMGSIMSIYSALLAVDGVFLGNDNGILGNTISETINNLAMISNKGMENMNSVIVNIMQNKNSQKLA